MFLYYALVVVVTAQRIAPDAYPALSDELLFITWRKQRLQRFLQAELASAPELLAGIDWTGQPKRASVSPAAPALRAHVGEVRSAFTANLRAGDRPLPRSWAA